MKAKTKKNPYAVSWKKDWQKNKTVYLIFLPVFLYFLIFHYLPMFGLVMAFQDFSLAKGVFRSPFNGLDNFIELFSGEAFPNALKNTLIMAAFSLTIGFAAPIVFALLITSVKNKKLRRTCQTISYLPNFVAAVVVTSLVKMFLTYDGPLTALLTSLGFEQQNWLANDKPPVFWVINCLMGVWQSFGYGSILFVASIMNINGDLHEAAAIDGATRWQRIWKITIPSIMPMIVMMFVLQIGLIFKTGSDKILLLYMPQTYSVADCLYTYTYRLGFGSSPDFGLAAASGLFQSVAGTVLLLLSNKLSRKWSDASLY
ncbi:MAG: ABC transporter permease subunit [Eubacteriales bacterium]|nr:ABC transporter permease subunit [Eubacteriales bacterium]